MRANWPDDDEPKPAPQPLRRIQALVNTVERPDGADRLADPSDARPWMIANGLLAPSAELTAADLALAIEVREALRALLIHNAGGPRPGPRRWPHCSGSRRRAGCRQRSGTEVW
ncbi:ABATE domain-containing protein [Mycolicibacterium vanbaalenii]|uniref:ABATE domain-containing protein n=1 Tax=Mycolicibacterium vanbaalenii TaxID=110539 RepID=UPI0027E38F87|nr:ABATE domain-containing protein [Mycolicibacterium vanbaalenii]